MNLSPEMGQDAYYQALEDFPFSYDLQNMKMRRNFEEKVLELFPLREEDHDRREISLIEDWKRLVAIIQDIYGSPRIYRGYGGIKQCLDLDGNLFTPEPSTALNYALQRASDYGSTTPAILALDLNRLLDIAERLKIKEPLITSTNTLFNIGVDRALLDQIGDKLNIVTRFRVKQK